MAHVGQALTDGSLDSPLISLPCSLGLDVTPDLLLQQQAHGASFPRMPSCHFHKQTNWFLTFTARLVSFLLSVFRALEDMNE